VITLHAAMTFDTMMRLVQNKVSKKLWTLQQHSRLKINWILQKKTVGTQIKAFL
jgi:hypothetical protein